MSEKAKKVYVTSPTGVAVYPHLLEMDSYQLKEHRKKEFNTGLLLNPENEADAAFIAQLDALAAEAFEDAKAQLQAKIDSPDTKGKDKASAKQALAGLELHIPYKPEYDDEGDETGKVIVHTKCMAGGTDKKTGKDWTKTLPIFDANGQPVTTQDRTEMKLWGGSQIAFSAEVFPFVAEGLKLGGISLRLQAAQVIEANGGGNRSADSFGFGVVEGGFTTNNFTNAASGDTGSDAEEEAAVDDDF